jgi:putative tricarboxylic transport membrane protein
MLISVYRPNNGASRSLCVTRIHKDIIAGIAFAILAVGYWLGAGNIPKSLLEGGVGAEALPKVLGIVLLILAAILVLQTILGNRRKKPPAGDEDREGEESETSGLSGFQRHKRALALLLIGIGYILFVEVVGYAPAIAYLLAAATWFAGGASRRTIILFAVLGGVFFWLLFVEILGIRQPQGYWPKLWHQVSSHAENADPANAARSAIL